jgi:hypothetical protein
VGIKGMLSWPRGQLSAVMLAVVAVLACGCGTSDHAGGDGATPAPPKGAPTFQPDTRQSAALGTLRQLDPCALIDVAVARVVGGGDPADLVRKAPHACSAYTGVQIDMIYDAVSHGQRYAAKPIVIDGRPTNRPWPGEHRLRVHRAGELRARIAVRGDLAAR